MGESHCSVARLLQLEGNGIYDRRPVLSAWKIFLIVKVPMYVRTVNKYSCRMEMCISRVYAYRIFNAYMNWNVVYLPLGCLRCNNKIPETEWFLNTGSFFVMVLSLQPEVSWLAGQVPSEDLLSASRSCACTEPCSHVAEGTRAERQNLLPFVHKGRLLMA